MSSVSFDACGLNTRTIRAQLGIFYFDTCSFDIKNNTLLPFLSLKPCVKRPNSLHITCDHLFLSNPRMSSFCFS